MRSTLLALVAIAVVTPAAAQTPPAQPYLPKGAAPDATRYLNPPPAKASAEDKADETAFLATRKLQGSARWTMAQGDNISAPDAILSDFSCALGVELNGQNAPALMTLMSRAARDVRPVVDPPKDLFKRPRPFVGTKLAVCVPINDSLANSASYPSGHSTTSWALALILSELVPDRATEVFMRARAYGESRVVCGVHYPSDVDAGRTSASALVAVLHSNPEFRADMERARAEIAAARQSAAAATDESQCAIQNDAGAHRPW